MARRITTENIIIGNPKITINNTKIIEQKPKKKFRVLVQERKSEGNKVEKMRSFMIYDFSGRATVDSVKRKLQKVMR